MPAPLCLRWGAHEESMGHMLLDCARSSSIWRALKFGFYFSLCTPRPFDQRFVDWMPEALANDLRCLSMFFLWDIWRDRNRAIFDNVLLPSPKQVVSQALSGWQLYRPSPPPLPFSPGGLPKVVQPAAHLSCLQIDGAFHLHPAMARGGWVLSAPDGQVLSSGGCLFPAVSPLQVEALACLFALEHMISLAPQGLLLHTDCLVLAQVLLNQLEPPR
ncbi:OLC1v1027859C1 [Oldenlandia corymbosa var. corymbosa]|uniref:OLC1v1027859C1 n=1 Tax=Oldenlandia corymbosa var. corymbosa TaxID=529605 RepID=A0AAV1CAE3_OLDCO|nr:OLC1v1027859C1 [Oldenlandia corymbosa var. corymbosa]